MKNAISSELQLGDKELQRVHFDHNRTLDLHLNLCLITLWINVGEPGGLFDCFKII